MGRLIDLSHTVEDGMTTYPGLPAPRICDYLSRADSRSHYAPGTEFHIGRIDMVANTGTYVDSPFHRFEDGADLAELPLEHLADLPTVVLSCPTGNERGIEAGALAGVDVRGKAVLFHTGWDRHWRSSQYDTDHPYLTAGMAQALRDGGAVLVGIDSLNIDSLEDLSRPVHTTLLRAGVPICEHMTGLAALPERGARFFAVPVKVRRFGTFPVRAFAIA